MTTPQVRWRGVRVAFPRNPDGTVDASRVLGWSAAFLLVVSVVLGQAIQYQDRSDRAALLSRRDAQIASLEAKIADAQARQDCRNVYSADITETQAAVIVAAARRAAGAPAPEYGPLAAALDDALRARAAYDANPVLPCPASEPVAPATTSPPTTG